MAKQPLELGSTIRREKPEPIPQRGGDEEKRVSLTLRLSEAEYERLALHGVKTRQKHQQIIHSALLRYLNDVNA